MSWEQAKEFESAILQSHFAFSSEHEGTLRGRNRKV